MFPKSTLIISAVAVILFGLFAFSPTASAYQIGVSPNMLSLRSGLVGYWTFDGKDMLNGVALDKSGNFATGTPVNIATSTFYAAGKLGQGANFDGVNDFINISRAVSTRSVSFWIKPTTDSASMVNLTATAYITASAGSITATGFTSPTVYVNGITGSTLTANAWNHIIVTDTANTSANAITLGKANSAFTAGIMDDVRVYNRALSANEVTQLYNVGR